MKKFCWSWFRWLAVLVWLGTLLFLSFQTGEETAETSGRLATLVHRMLSGLGVQADYASVHAALRITAHVAVFLVFGILLEAAVLGSFRYANTRRGVLITLFVCAVISVLSEVLKIYIPGRHLDWPEAGLNGLSAWLGCGGVFVLKRWRA